MAGVVARSQQWFLSNRNAKFMDRTPLAARLSRLDDNHSIHAYHNGRLVEKESAYRSEPADLSRGNCFGDRRIFVRAFVERDKRFVVHCGLEFAS